MYRCGLYLLDRTTFDRMIPDWTDRRDSVRYITGCMEITIPIGTLVSNEQPGTTDIAGGGFPESFMNTARE